MLQHYIAAGLFTPGGTPTPTPGVGGFMDYAALQSSIGAWLKRNSDVDFVARVPDFIRLTETRLNRLLRDPDQIVTTTVAITNGQGSLPADFGEMLAFGAGGTRLHGVTPAEFSTYQSIAGDPIVYALSGGKLLVNPSQGSPVTPITYYRSIPPLSDTNSTNWLLTRAPDLYLYGALLQAEFYGWNDERLPFIKGAFDEAIGELSADGASRRWGAAPLMARIRRS